MKKWVLIGLLVALAGCKNLGEKPSEAGEEAARAGTADAEGATTQGLRGEEGEVLYEVETGGIAEDGAGAGAGPGADAGGLLAKRTIYFAFDSAQVQAEDIPVIEAHAAYLLAHPQAGVVLEGHTDERGSREYNIALAEARAKAVSKLLGLQGVADDRMRIVSYGEEKPVAMGHDEEAWRQNRRVEIVYRGE
ncbi:MAG: hypothetical protein Kow0060_05120 [Methylohalobius crimeensis]